MASFSAFQRGEPLSCAQWVEGGLEGCVCEGTGDTGWGRLPTLTCAWLAPGRCCGNAELQGIIGDCVTHMLLDVPSGNKSGGEGGGGDGMGVTSTVGECVAVCGHMGVPPQICVDAWFLDSSCLSVTVSMSQSLHPWPSSLIIEPLLFRGSSGSHLLPGEGVGVTQELLAAWGWRTVQNSDLLSHWALLEVVVWSAQSGSAFAVFLSGFLLRRRFRNS